MVLNTTYCLKVIWFLSPVQTFLLNFSETYFQLFDMCTWICNKHHTFKMSTLNSWSASAYAYTLPGEWNERPALRRAVHSEDAEWEQMGWLERIHIFGEIWPGELLGSLRFTQPFTLYVCSFQSKKLFLWQPWLGGITVLRCCGTSEICCIISNAFLFFHSDFLFHTQWLLACRWEVLPAYWMLPSSLGQEVFKL